MAAPSAAEVAALTDEAAAAVEGFRRRAASEVRVLAEATAGGISSKVLGRSLAAAAEAELDAALGADASDGRRATAQAAAEREMRDIVAAVEVLEANLRETKQLKAEKADILAIGFQTTTGENQEFAALVVCATAGIFAVSLHFSFFVIWAAAYALYKRATRQIREQRAASDDLGTLVARLRVLEDIEVQLRSRVREQAVALAAGRAPPPQPAVQPSAAAEAV